MAIASRIETSPDGAWTFAPESMRSIPKDRELVADIATCCVDSLLLHDVELC